MPAGMRRVPLPGLALAMLLAAAPVGAAEAAGGSWPQFQSFVEHFVSDDGRVIDPAAAERYTTSEGQSYALFFALVADDRAVFERLLEWTRDNLAAGDFGAHLPAWQWGRRGDGSWGVTDPNPASDADLWLAFTLLEAGRHWHAREYRILGKLVAHRLLDAETDDLPGLGPTLLPGPVGFHPQAGRWRLNPSYVPLPLLRALARADDSRADTWQALAHSAQALVLGSAGHGYAPDWVIYDAAGGFRVDDKTAGIGSYNAIRVYLWAGLMADDPERRQQLDALSGMAGRLPPPETVDTRDGTPHGRGPSGFAAALIPYQRALQHPEAALELSRQVAAAGWPLPGYYDSVLTLFALGHEQGRYCFDGDGRLHIGEPKPCAAIGS